MMYYIVELKNLVQCMHRLYNMSNKRKIELIVSIVLTVMLSSLFMYKNDKKY